ncbi:MAG: hypothetical protein II740_10370 [Lachnospiraceae bacterium]|nr:hypothetical protein [Lachnospiraceae bacterium]
MKVIYRPRNTYKTTELIKESAKTGIYIMTLTRKRADTILYHAQTLGLNIPNPVTLQDYKRTNGFQGSFIKEILIDDVDDILKEIFRRVEIKTITMTDREPKEECEFCKTIIPEEDADDRAFCQGKYKGCREESFIWRDKDDGALCIEAPSGDPYEVGLVCNIKYCPYCGRKLESEDKA